MDRYPAILTIAEHSISVPHPRCWVRKAATESVDSDATSLGFEKSMQSLFTFNSTRFTTLYIGTVTEQCLTKAPLRTNVRWMSQYKEQWFRLHSRISSFTICDGRWWAVVVCGSCLFTMFQPKKNRLLRHLFQYFKRQNIQLTMKLIWTSLSKPEPPFLTPPFDSLHCYHSEPNQFDRFTIWLHLILWLWQVLSRPDRTQKLQPSFKPSFSLF